jgi:hypothetical protein
MDSAKRPKYEILPVLEVALDAANPRIAKWIEMYGGDITGEQMSMALGAADESLRVQWRLSSVSPTVSVLPDSVQ